MCMQIMLGRLPNVKKSTQNPWWFQRKFNLNHMFPLIKNEIRLPWRTWRQTSVKTQRTDPKFLTFSGSSPPQISARERSGGSSSEVIELMLDKRSELDARHACVGEEEVGEEERGGKEEERGGRQTLTAQDSTLSTSSLANLRIWCSCNEKINWKGEFAQIFLKAKYSKMKFNTKIRKFH